MQIIPKNGFRTGSAACGFVKVASVVLLLLGWAGAAHAEDISGNITSTKVITENSQLVGDVNCGVIAGPCILFGAPNITLKLNGFTITGPSNPDDSPTCNPTSGAPAADLISNGGQTVFKSSDQEWYRSLNAMEYS